MKLRTLSLTVFLCGSALFTGSVMKSHKAEKPLEEARPFVVQYLVSRSQKGGPLVPYGLWIRAVSSTGEWKETRYSFDGKVSTWGGAADGLYFVSNNTRQYYGETNMEISKTAMRSEQQLRNHPQLIRTEQVAGLNTYTLREPNGIEASFSPQTGVTALKQAVYSSPGSDTIIHLLEALSVQFRELSESEARLPDLPVRFDIAEQKVQSLRSAGHTERADALLQAISKLKSASQ